MRGEGAPPAALPPRSATPRRRRVGLRRGIRGARCLHDDHGLARDEGRGGPLRGEHLRRVTAWPAVERVGIAVRRERVEHVVSRRRRARRRCRALPRAVVAVLAADECRRRCHRAARHRRSHRGPRRRPSRPRHVSSSLPPPKCVATDAAEDPMSMPLSPWTPSSLCRRGRRSSPASALTRSSPSKARITSALRRAAQPVVARRPVDHGCGRGCSEHERDERGRAPRRASPSVHVLPLLGRSCRPHSPPPA